MNLPNICLSGVSIYTATTVCIVVMLMNENIYIDTLSTITLMKATKGLLIYIYNKEERKERKKKILDLINALEDLIADLLEDATALPDGDGAQTRFIV